MFFDRKGDLIKDFKDGKLHIIAHGCNCKNLMGAGIAKTLRQKYPMVFEADRVFNLPKDRTRLGHFSICEISHKSIVLNFYTQENIYHRPNGDIPFEIDALERCLINLKTYLKEIEEMETLNAKFELNGGKLQIGFPHIGCGLAHGDINEVRHLINSFAESEFIRDVADVHLIEWEK